MLQRLSLLVLLLSLSQAAYAERLVFGVVPQQSAKKMARLWTPILKDLSKRTGHRVVFATARNIPTFESRLSKGHYDLAYMNPYHFVVFNESPGYQAVVKQRDKRIRGVIVARKGAGIASLDELNDTTLAFPAPAAFAASILTRGELQRQHVAFAPRYVSSHDSVYLNVAKGFFPAGGGVMRTLNNTPTEIRDQLEVIWTTSPYTPHAIAAHPELSADVLTELQRAFLAMNQSEESRTRLAGINFKGFEAAADSDWDDVRRLGIDTLVQEQ